MLPSLSMLTTTDLSFGCSARLSRVFGRLTSMPVCRIGAVTMKITNSTSITSTRGVTLISESDVCVRPRLSVKAILVCWFAALELRFGVMALDQVQQFQREAVERRRKSFDAVEKLIVKDRRRHRRGNAGGSRNQRFGDARSDSLYR